MLEHLTEASDQFHRAVVNKVVNGATSQSGNYEMVKVTFMLSSPGYEGEVVHKFYCHKAASRGASAKVVKDAIADLAKLYQVASKPAGSSPLGLVNSVVMIRLAKKPNKNGGTWINVTDVKAVEPVEQVDNTPKEDMPF